MTALTEFLLSQQLRKHTIGNDPSNVLYCAADVAARIGDADNYRRIIETYSEKYAVRTLFPDHQGRSRLMWFLTESGFNRYILQSNRKEADELQNELLDLIILARKRTTSDAEIVDKIERDAQEEHARKQANEAERETERETKREIAREEAHQKRLEREALGGSKYVREDKCREILKAITGVAFHKHRAPWLGRLELDGFNPRLKIAFEHQGRQHYELVPFFHRGGNEDLIAQQVRDQTKAKLCTEQEIDLIIIPYHVKDLERFIRQEYEAILNQRGLMTLTVDEIDDFLGDVFASSQNKHRQPFMQLQY